VLGGQAGEHSVLYLLVNLLRKTLDSLVNTADELDDVAKDAIKETALENLVTVAVDYHVDAVTGGCLHLRVCVLL